MIEHEDLWIDEYMHVCMYVSNFVQKMPQTANGSGSTDTS